MQQKPGPSAAFAELRNLYSQALYRTIVRITKNREDAEDALQAHSKVQERDFRPISDLICFACRGATICDLCQHSPWNSVIPLGRHEFNIIEDF
jgi:hypothetical protein